jgi:hypothetical protein
MPVSFSEELDGLEVLLVAIQRVLPSIAVRNYKSWCSFSEGDSEKEEYKDEKKWEMGEEETNVK